MKFTIDKREEIDSTNLEVIRRAKTGAPEGTLVQAERQISGRGRRGRAWESPAGSNLYMTLLLRPDVTMEQASVLTLIMALACQEGIKEATGLDCQIKWPNDLVLHKKKVVGILTEAAMLEQDEAFPEGASLCTGLRSRDQCKPEGISGRDCGQGNLPFHRKRQTLETG